MLYIPEDSQLEVFDNSLYETGINSIFIPRHMKQIKSIGFIPKTNLKIIEIDENCKIKIFKINMFDDALQLYKQAKEGGNLSGYAKYGSALIVEKFGIDNPIDGLININYAYQRNDPIAKNSYGCILSSGLAGFEVDKKNAITHYFKAAMDGCFIAFHNIGNFMWDGIGIDKSQSSAINFYEFGLGEGDISCAYVLSTCYNDPKSDIPVNKKLSKYYLQLAYDQGYEKAIKKLDKDKSQNEKSKCCLLI